MHRQHWTVFVLIACGSLALASPESTFATTIDVEFSNFTVGDMFPNASLPTTIVADGVDVALSKYNGSSGANGTIVDMPLFGSSNNALFLAADLRAEILLPANSSGGFFYFRDDGGSNFLEINGQLLAFTDSALAGAGSTTLGGVTVYSNVLDDPIRSVKLDGLIQSIAFIGQELTIDRVELTLVPEPATNLLALAGTFVLAITYVSRMRPTCAAAHHIDCVLNLPANRANGPGR